MARRSSSSTPLISVCIPTYEMGGQGATFLDHSLAILAQQQFKDFDVVISDHSPDFAIRDLCHRYRQKLTIHYYRNPHHRGSSSANINYAITKAKGRLLKILFQDDFLLGSTALTTIADHFDVAHDGWLVTACEHTHDGETLFRPFYPRYNHNIDIGKNTLGSPSVLTIKNDDPLLFDPDLKWLMDCDYYKRCYNRFGPPRIVNTITVVNRVGPHQVTNTLATKQVRQAEYDYILDKFRRGTLRDRYRQLAKTVHRQWRKTHG